MERSLLYVSRKTILLDRDAVELDNIVATSRERNPGWRITGGLISTPDAFAQLLEGDARAVDDLMEQIDRDSRHSDIRIVRFDPISSRRLPDWSLAYAGPSSYVAGRVTPLLGAGLESDPRRIDALMTLLVKFALATPEPRAVKR